MPKDPDLLNPNRPNSKHHLYPAVRRQVRQAALLGGKLDGAANRLIGQTMRTEATQTGQLEVGKVAGLLNVSLTRIVTIQAAMRKTEMRETEMLRSR